MIPVVVNKRIRRRLKRAVPNFKGAATAVRPSGAQAVVPMPPAADIPWRLVPFAAVSQGEAAGRRSWVRKGVLA